MALRKKSPHSEFFWSVSSRIWTEYRETRSIFPYSIRMKENKDQKNSKYGHFSCSEVFIFQLKCCFKSILGKNPIFLSAESFLFVLEMKHFLKCYFSKKLPQCKKYIGCTFGKIYLEIVCSCHVTYAF